MSDPSNSDDETTRLASQTGAPAEDEMRLESTTVAHETPLDNPASVWESVLPGAPRPRVSLRGEPSGAATATAEPAGPPQAPTGRYQILGEIARGGMGAVMRGRDSELNRDLAVKVVLERFRNDPEVLRRFFEEAQIGGQLQHPGIVPIYDIGTFPDKRPFFAMKLVKGRTLSAILKERATPADDLPGLLGIFEQVAQTVAYAHSKGVIHRDLKPANVMVGAFGEVQVMDWGLAKVLTSDREDEPEPETIVSLIRTPRGEGDSDATMAGSRLGTPAYMAPEQARGEVEALDERADVFGLGAILCEVLTGKPAYTGSRNEVVWKAERGDLAEALGRLEACGADGELVALTRACLAAEPAGRPRDAGVVAATIKAHLAGVQDRLRASEMARVEATAQAASERIRAEAERTRRKMTIALAATVVLAALAAGGSYFSSRLAGLKEQKAAEVAKLKEQQATDLWRREQHERKTQSSRAALARGQALCEEGAVDRGVAMIAHALEVAPDDERGLRWEILTDLDARRRQVHRLEHALVPSHKVLGLALSPDGKLALTGGEAGAQLWDVRTGAAIGAAIRGGASASAVAFSPDGSRILTGGNDGLAQVWDASTGRPLGPPMDHGAPIRALAFSPDGRAVATGGYGPRWVVTEGWARVWDASTGRPRTPRLLHAGWVWTLAFGPDGKTIVTAGTDATARLWDATDGRPLGELLHQHGWVWSAEFRPDGRSILVAGNDGLARLWEPAGGKPAVEFKHYDAVTAAAFSPDGATFATGCGDGTVWLRDAATHARVGEIMRHRQFVASVRFSTDGKVLLTCSKDGTVRLWDAATGRPVGGAMQHPGNVVAASIARDGKTVVTLCEDGIARVWGVSQSRIFEPALVHSDVRWVDSVAFAPDGRRLLTGGGDGVARLWVIGSAEPEATMRHAESTSVRAVAFSRDGRVAATGGSDRTARLWDLPTGRQLVEIRHEHEASINALAFGPDGRLLTGGDDGIAQLWAAGLAAPAAPPMRHAEGSQVKAVAFSPGGRTLATGGTDRMVRLWDAGTGLQVGEIGHGADVNALAFGPDGRRLLIGGGDGIARLWAAGSADPASWRTGSVEAVGSPMRLDGSLLAAAFSPDGRSVATGGTDREAHLWDAETGRRIGPTLQRQLGFICGIAFAPDGRAIATGAADGTARLWDVPRPADDDAARASLRSQVETNLRFERVVDEVAVFRPLTHEEWRKAVAKLEASSGNPARGGSGGKVKGAGK